MAKSNRGGRRHGAGRKASLSTLERIAVGALIARRLSDASQNSFVKSVEKKLHPELEERWRLLREIPVANRLRWQKSNDDPTIDDLLGDIADNIGDTTNEETGEETEGQRYFFNPGKPAYGVRKQIIHDVAQESSRLYNLAISDSLAERCLEEYRKMQKRLEKEAGDPSV